MAVLSPFTILAILPPLFNGINAMGTASNNSYVNTFRGSDASGSVFRTYSMTRDHYFYGLGQSNGNSYVVGFIFNNDNSDSLIKMSIDEWENESYHTCSQISIVHYQYTDFNMGSILGIGTEEYTNNFENIKYSITYTTGYGAQYTYMNDLGHSRSSTSAVYHFEDTSGDYIYRSGDPYFVNITFSIMVGDSHYETYWQNGYQEGLQVDDPGWNLSNYLFSIVDLPVLYLRSLFGFDLFGGISLFAVITTLITIAVASWVIRKFI